MQIPLNPSSITDNSDASPVGVLVSRDLIFTTKITGTARALGHRIAVAGNEALALKTIAEAKPRVIFVDLAAGGLGKPEALRAYQQAAGPETPIVAFGSHVDTEALDAARGAGCREVLPRSKFSAELPELIGTYCGGSKMA
jgi:CheY-like chemotaxis protein